MAIGDITIFNEARATMLDGGWESADTIKLALITSTTVPTQADVTPVLGDYTQVTAGGNYTAGGEALDSWGNMITQSAGTVTFDDTGASVSWAQHASNPTNARYGIFYNDTDTAGPDSAIGFIDLGSTIDMTTGDLTITWNASGIFTIS